MHSGSDQASPECEGTLFTNFHTWENIQRKFRKSCQKSVSSSAKMLILKLFLLLLKSKAISQLKIKNPIFFKSFLVYKFLYARCNCYIGEPVLTLKQESMNMCKMTKNLIFTSAQ